MFRQGWPGAGPAHGSAGAMAPTAMQPPYHSTLALLYRQHWQPLQQWLARHFPRTSAALVEDAVSDAFHDALACPASFAPAWKRDDHSALVRLLRQVAWRRLRGRLRKKSSQCEVSSEAIEALDVDTPDVLASSRELTLRVHQLVDQAALRFGGNRSQALRAALHDRLEGGTDTEAARAHGIPREYVNRAKRWIAMELFLA